MYQSKFGVLVRKNQWFKRISVAAALLLLGACSDPVPLQTTGLTTGSALAQTEEQLPIAQDVSFDINLSAVLKEKISETAGDKRTINALSPEIWTGILVAENIESGETETRPWNIRLEDSGFSIAESLSTMPITPGFYEFRMSVVNGTQQYIGTAIYEIQDGEQSILPMTIRPVLGDSLVDVIIEENLIDFGFSYSAEEFDAANLTDPYVSISIDGGTEDVFILNPATGLSDDLFFVNLTPGNYQISIAFFDSGFQKAKSIEAQQSVNVVAGLDINMDLVPLHGEISFTNFTETTDLQVEVQVPADVVDEVGGLGNLLAFLRIVGNNTPSADIPLALFPDGTQYTASATVPDASGEDLVFEMQFIDLQSGEDVASCVNEAEVNALGTTVNCPISLKRRAVFTGSLLSTLGLNVFDSSGFPLPGAVVSIDGQVAGITSDGSFFTPGYTTLNIKPGQYLVSATFGNEVSEVIYDSIPLNVTSINMIMGQTVNLADPLLFDNFIDPQTGTSAPVDYWFGCNGQGFPDFTFGGVGRLKLSSYQNDPETDYCFGTSAVTSHSFTDADILDAGGFQVDVDLVKTNNPTANLAIGIGEEFVGDANNFNPIPSLDAIVDLFDNGIVVRIFDNGTATSVTTYPIPFAIDDIDSLMLDVQIDSFAPGSPATLMVYVNDISSFVPSTQFTWDGGSNHIELRGGTTEPAIEASVVIDSLTIQPR